MQQDASPAPLLVAFLPFFPLALNVCRTPRPWVGWQWRIREQEPRVAVGTLLFDAVSGPPMGAGEGLGAAAPSPAEFQDPPGAAHGLGERRTPPAQTQGSEPSNEPWRQQHSAAHPAAAPLCSTPGCCSFHPNSPPPKKKKRVTHRGGPAGGCSATASPGGCCPPAEGQHFGGGVGTAVQRGGDTRSSRPAPALAGTECAGAGAALRGPGIS